VSGGAASAGVAPCRSCGADPRADARFCDGCGATLSADHGRAEFKQVTVMFADVVHSMDIAAEVGAERLREIMADLFHRCSAVVRRFGGTVNQFTGDGMMAVFGAPIALEDHASRACLAALDIQLAVQRLGVEVEERDGVVLRLRIGLNSGEVIAGEMGSGPGSYTTIGEQVGMAQRMESVAPPGGVMLSESTARLVEGVAELGELEKVPIKGAVAPVPARRLLAAIERTHRRRSDPTLVGRAWELNSIAGLLDEAIGGAGCVVGVAGPPGIGKSRIVREALALATGRGIDVFSSYCESHTSSAAFHAVTALLRASFGVNGLDGPQARARVREMIPAADPDDLLLLDDLLGIADEKAELPTIEADARGRRLTRLLNAAAVAAEQPAIYIVEDVHWIDDASEAMLAEFMAVVPQTSSLVLITYRPEYRGVLANRTGAQTITLRPLSDNPISALIDELLGPDPSVRWLADHIAERAAGNPFFVEEIVRDFAERGVVQGRRGAYIARDQRAEVNVPATLQATIAARIDRLGSDAKRTLSAAAVVGSRFHPDLLTRLEVEPTFDELINADLVDQVQFGSSAEYAFRHPLIRAVAYESQLRSDRADLHRRLAAAIEERRPESDENAFQIAEHLEAASDWHEAFKWYMRAGSWLTNRDIAAARASWERARGVADRLPAGDTDRAAMRIHPRTLLCASAFRGGGSIAAHGYDELRELCVAADDQVSLAVGMSGLPVSLTLLDRHFEASQSAEAVVALLDSISDPTLTVGLMHGAMTAKFHAGELADALTVTQRVIDLADGDIQKGELLIGAPVAQATMIRGLARLGSGRPGWKDDFDQADAMTLTSDAITRVICTAYPRGISMLNGAMLSNAAMIQKTGEALRIAEQSGDNFTLSMARFVHGIALLRLDETDHTFGQDLLALARESNVHTGSTFGLTPVDVQTAVYRLETGDIEAAIAMSRSLVEHMNKSGEKILRGPATAVLVEALLRHGTDADVLDAEAMADDLAAVPTETGFVLFELPLLRLRALVAVARGDKAGYRDFAGKYREMANDLGFEGHMAIAATM
jgi:class 3 adenylate cyclase